MAENTPQTISDYKTFYHRYNDAIQDVATREVHRVFKLLYKGGESYVGEYLDTIDESMTNQKGKEKKKLINMTALKGKEKKKLKDKVPTEKMDMSMLYEIIRYTCGLSSPDSNIWDKPENQSQEKSIEHSLYKLKEHRNEVSHESDRLKKLSDNELVKKIDEVSDLCRIVLNGAGSISGKLQEAAVALTNMERDLKNIMGVTPEQVAALGRKEKQESTAGRDMDFYSLPIMDHKGNLLKLTDLFQIRLEQDNRSSIIAIRGDAGAGKSSLCQYLDWLWTKGFENVSELQTHDLTLTIDCRDVCTRDIKELLRRELLPSTMKWCNPDNILQHVGDLKLLWIIDSLDEATDEATDLIRHLIKRQNANHTFLIASRYECVDSIMKDLEDQEYATVFLHGVDPEDMFTKLKTYKNAECPDLKGMISDFHSLNEAVKSEFKNPLKLKYAMKNWGEVCKTLTTGFSLTQLYETIQNAQIEQVANTCTKGKTTKNDAKRRVKSWYQCLCKVAFQATAARHGIELTNNHIDQLERDCDILQIPSSDYCLSSFLAHRPTGTYQFFHQTQRDFFAAIHAASIFEQCEQLDQISKQFGISEINPNKKELLHFYGVLLHMVAILKDSIGKEKAQELIRLLNSGILEINASSKWLEVIKQGDYKEIFICPIKEYFPTRWQIGDHNIVAAEHFLGFFKPSVILITIISEPEKVLPLQSFLSKISTVEPSVDVELLLISHFQISESSANSDNYLQRLVHENSHCFISRFCGALTKIGLDLFESQTIRSTCRILNLKITNIYDMIPLCSNIRHFQKIDYLQLVLDFNFDEVIELPCKIPDNVTDLLLPKMTDEQVMEAIIFLKRLTRKYKGIVFWLLTCNGALKFASQAKMTGLRVHDYSREGVNPNGSISNMTFGPLPLQYSAKFFQVLWENFEMLRKIEIKVEFIPEQIEQELPSENMSSETKEKK